MIINFNDFTNEEMKNIQKVYYVAEKELLLSKEMEVNLVIVSPETIKEMNNEYRQVDRVTDVLSFPMLDNIDDLNKECDAILGEVNIGDIYICRERAIEQAIEYKHSLKREICFLALHGLLHLLGYDHIKKEDEQIMFQLQDKILQMAKITRD
mgnify:CR=1 FL=1